MNLLKFDNISFEGKLKGMDTIFLAQTASMQEYTPTQKYRQKFLTVPAKTMDVLYEVLRAYKGTSQTVINAGCASTNNGYVAEICAGTSPDVKTVVAVLRKRDGSYYVKAASITKDEIIISIPNADNDLDVRFTVMLALMPLFLQDAETFQIYNTMSDYLEWDVNSANWDINNGVHDFAILLNQMSTNVQMMLTDGTIRISDGVSILKQADLQISQVKEYCGSLAIFKNSDSKAASAETPEITKMNPGESPEGKFRYNPERVWAPNEEQMKTKLASTYIMPDFVTEICTYMQASTIFPSPMRVSYLIGPAGTGKTEAAKAICALTGLPYDHYTCNPNTEIFDFLGQMLPNVASEECSFDEIRRNMNLPSTEDIVNDPVSAYEMIYKATPEGYPDEGELVAEMVRKVMANASTARKDFVYVESGLVKAIKNGYGFEIQEIGCVLRPGVAVGLNALLETGDNSFITLPTGEVVKRHPDCTIIFTSNDEYEGTCNLNQSVLDRMSLVYRIENPTKEVMMNRIKSRLGFDDDLTLSKMISVIMDLSKAAQDKDITDGVCGYRSLENWCMAVMIQKRLNNNVITDEICYKTAITTVMNKVSQHKEYIEELMSSLTYYFAAPNNI